MKKSPHAAIKGVVTLSGSQPFSKLLREMNIVIGSITTLEISPARNEINTKSYKLMLGKPKAMQISLATIPSKTDKTMVRIIEEIMFSARMSERLNSGDNVPIWRWVLNLEPKDPNMFPLIPIAPGIITMSPGNALR